MQSFKSLAILATVLISSLLPVPASAQKVAGVAVINNTKHAIWVTFYQASGRRDKLTYGCVPAGKTISLSWGKFVSSYYTLGEIKEDGNSCSDHSNKKVIEADRISDRFHVQYDQQGTYFSYKSM